MANRVGKHLLRKSKLAARFSNFEEQQNENDDDAKKGEIEMYLNTDRRLGSTLSFFYPMALDVSLC